MKTEFEIKLIIKKLQNDVRVRKKILKEQDQEYDLDKLKSDIETLMYTIFWVKYILN